MTVDWNGAASGWNRASDDWKNYRSPVARKPLAPVGNKLPEMGHCKCGCGYAYCSRIGRAEPPVDWLFESITRSQLTDRLTNRLRGAGIQPGEKHFYHQHWALEQLMRGMTLSMQTVRGGQVRIGKGLRTKVQVRLDESNWTTGLDVVDWLMAGAPSALGVFYAPTKSKYGPDLEPRKPLPPSSNQMLDQLLAQRMQTEENVAKARKLQAEQASLKAAQQAYSKFLDQPGYESLRALGAEQQRQDQSFKLREPSRAGGDINFQAFSLQAPLNPSPNIIFTPPTAPAEPTVKGTPDYAFPVYVK